MLKVQLKSVSRIAFLGAGIFCGAFSLAEGPTALVQRALKARDSVKASITLVDAAKKSASSLSASPATRLEFGSGTRPDVNGGEDLTLFQPLDIFGKNRATRASGNAGVKAAEAGLVQTKLDVQTEVLTAFATWANATRNQSSANNQLDIAKQLEKATKARVDARALPELQMTRASLEVQRAEQVVIDRDATVRSAWVKLNQSSGGSVGEVTADSFETISLAMAEPQNNRPDLLLLVSQRNGFAADERTARLSQLPDFELQGRRSPWATPEQYGIRFQFVVPLWDHGVAKNRAAAAQRQVDATSLQYTDAAKKVVAEIEAARIQLEAAKKSLEAYAKLVSGTKDLMDKTQRGFELGANSLTDVLDAKRTLSDAAEQRSNAQLSLDLAVTELLRSQGQLLGEIYR